MLNVTTLLFSKMVWMDLFSIDNYGTVIDEMENKALMTAVIPDNIIFLFVCIPFIVSLSQRYSVVYGNGMSV